MKSVRQCAFLVFIGSKPAMPETHKWTAALVSSVDLLEPQNGFGEPNRILNARAYR